MSFAVWTSPPPFGPGDLGEGEVIYAVGEVWVITDDPERATQAEVDKVLLTPAQLHNAAIDAQIKALEQEQILARGVREFTLYCMARDAQRDFNLTEPQLYAAQVGYRRLKDFDDVIKALRVQRMP